MPEFLFLMKLQGEACNFINKNILTQAISCEICEIFKNILFCRTPYFFPKLKQKILRPCRVISHFWTSKTESLPAVVNDFLPLTIVTKLSILDVFGGPGYALVSKYIVEAFSRTSWIFPDLLNIPKNFEHCLKNEVFQ